MSGNDDSLAGVIQVLGRILQLAETSALASDTRLLGGIPEFDSLAVASVVIGLEEHFDIEFDDEDIDADLFETVGSLAGFVDRLRRGTTAARDTKALSGGPEPFFLRATSGSLFVIVRNADDNPGSRCVVFVAPFAEEMNRARPLITMAAMTLNQAGLSCCSFDFYGTGDSGGDFADARWPLWLGDLHDIVTHLRAKGFRDIDLVGIRLGALLAVEYANAFQNQIARIVFWDPVFDGKTYISRFLRTRTMASMMAGETESVKQLIARLHDGHSVEVGGYELHPEMAAAVAGYGLTDQRDLPDTPIFWITQDTAADPQSAAAAMGLQLNGVVNREYERYWDSAEPTDVSALIEATRECLTQS